MHDISLSELPPPRSSIPLSTLFSSVLSAARFHASNGRSSMIFRDIQSAVPAPDLGYVAEEGEVQRGLVGVEA